MKMNPGKEAKLGKKGKKGKKAQIWYTDFMVAVLLFVIALVIYYEYMTNISIKERSIIDELTADAKGISSSLIATGVPNNWTQSSVVRIGITDGDYRINTTKLEMFYNMSYADSYKYFGTRFDYYVFFENSSGNRINLSYVDAVGKEPVDINNLVQITRLLINGSDIVKMQVQVWRTE